MPGQSFIKCTSFTLLHRIAICYIHHLQKTLRLSEEDYDYEYERPISPAPLPKTIFRSTITNQWPKIPNGKTTEFNLYQEPNHFDQRAI